MVDGTYVGEKTTINGNTYIISYVYDENGAPAGLNINGSACYFVKNLQGDILGLMSHTGTVFARYYYDAWGNLIYVRDANGNNITNEESVALLNPFRYRGYFYDSETGFYYLGSRYYDPAVCRWLNADTPDVLTATPNELTDKNLFAYCDNNPVTRADHGGEFWTCALSPIGTGFLTSFPIMSLLKPAAVFISSITPLGWGIIITTTVVVAVTVGIVYAKSKGKENQRDTGLIGVSDEEIESRLKDPNTSKEEKRRLQKEQKARGNRNKNKRAGNSRSK